MTISRNDMKLLLDKMQVEEQTLRKAGQLEYAQDEANALANFERVATLVGISREQVLAVYMLKHIDGIMSWIKGHKSQRENVRGRINDARVYLALLRGMVEELESNDVS